jgi:hypothetical protein
MSGSMSGVGGRGGGGPEHRVRTIFTYQVQEVLILYQRCTLLILLADVLDQGVNGLPDLCF